MMPTRRCSRDSGIVPLNTRLAAAARSGSIQSGKSRDISRSVYHPLNRLSNIAMSEKQAFAMPPLVLASSSPYRRALLERLQLAFSVHAPQVDETPRSGERGDQLAVRLARAKSEALSPVPNGALVIGSDQVAECRNRLLGKPGSVEQACRQLASISGQRVVFHTAVAVSDGHRTEARLVPTEVHMRHLSPAGIRSYVEADRPLDCAGAMRSESLGIGLTTAICSNDPTALIGLPLIALVELLDLFGLGLPPYGAINVLHRD